MATDLDALETFATAVRTGSFAAAARVLGVTPAMVGRRIQGLEQRYGTRLIERTTRAQRLTEAGETFLARAEAVLDAAAELEDSMRSAPGRLEGRIRMTGPATLGVYKLAGQEGPPSISAPVLSRKGQALYDRIKDNDPSLVQYTGRGAYTGFMDNKNTVGNTDPVGPRPTARFSAP